MQRLLNSETIATKDERTRDERTIRFRVIPAKAGIYSLLYVLDSCFRRNDTGMRIVHRPSSIVHRRFYGVWFVAYPIALIISMFLCMSAYSDEAYTYDSHGKRDPFVPLVGSVLKTIGSLEDVMSIEDIELQGIASDSKGKRAAIMNGEIIKASETVGRVTLKEISRDEVVLMIDEEEYRVNIYKEGTR